MSQTIRQKIPRSSVATSRDKKGARSTKVEIRLGSEDNADVPKHSNPRIRRGAPHKLTNGGETGILLHLHICLTSMLLDVIMA